jgi:hypothetical protein
MVWSRRKWFTTSLWISFSSGMDDWNRCGCEVAMAARKLCYNKELVWARRWRSRGGRREMAAVWKMVRVDGQIPFLRVAAMRGTQQFTRLRWSYGSTGGFNLIVKRIYFHLFVIEEIIRDIINLITNFQIKREKESTFGVIAKFDSWINSWDLVWESGAIPNRCTYLCFFKIWLPNQFLRRFGTGVGGYT